VAGDRLAAGGGGFSGEPSSGFTGETDASAWLPDPAAPIRVVRGPDPERFGEGAWAEFRAATWRIGHASDRVGTRLVGPALARRDGDGALSMPMVEGAIQVPAAGEPIVNVHFRLPRPPRGDGSVELMGVVGGFAQWIFVRGDIVSITISAASEEAQLDAGEIAARCWDDVQVVLGVDGPLPPFRVVKEKRATFAQDPATVARRPGPATSLSNLFLAGDWTNTGLPATIEGAIRSGAKAAGLAWRPEKGRKP